MLAPTQIRVCPEMRIFVRTQGSPDADAGEKILPQAEKLFAEDEILPITPKSGW